ncbi:hypothetical protein NFI96_023155 [Prochilodus magdalenae]|nr:hypothetical protein NFI96_023155 [Prochilodus magdalenae]
MRPRRLFKSHAPQYQGHIGSSLIVGGVDVDGPQLYSIYPHGSYDKLPFLTMAQWIIPLPTSESPPQVGGWGSVHGLGDYAVLHQLESLGSEHYTGPPVIRLTCSGADAAVAVFEDRFKPKMELEEAKRLVRDAITAGIFCDLGSGSNVDLCVITEKGVDFLRGYDKPTQKGQREGSYRYKPGTTPILTKTVTPLTLDVVEEAVQTMDTQ